MNTCGHTPAEEMAAFDSLPKKLREAFSASPLCACAVELAAVRVGFLAPSDAEILRHLRIAERQIAV